MAAGFEADPAFRLTGPPDGIGTGNAKNAEAIEDCSADLDLGDLSIGLARAWALAS